MRHLADGDTLALLRRLLLAVLLAGMAGTAVELVLLGHTEEWTQWIPLALFGLAAPVVGALWARPTRPRIQLFRVLMGCFIGSGIVGQVLHLKGNVEFELEMRPSMAGLELAWNALTGATPALAPGSMILLGLLGLLAAFRMPAPVPETEGGTGTTATRETRESR